MRNLEAEAGEKLTDGTNSDFYFDIKCEIVEKEKCCFSFSRFCTRQLNCEYFSIFLRNKTVFRSSSLDSFCLRHIQATNTMVKMPVLSTMTTSYITSFRYKYLHQTVLN